MCQKPVVLFAAVDASNCFDNKNAFRCSTLFSLSKQLSYHLPLNSMHKKGIKKSGYFFFTLPFYFSSTLFSVRERDVL